VAHDRALFLGVVKTVMNHEYHHHHHHYALRDLGLVARSSLCI
jgi:hypothetical protein